ncbi:TetR/AcrR family transcriptional regulator [Novosphingobium sp. 9U]|uniref:TetR/AcrR family transcriptional regulator n=1 Tax=Novosphingobium sp. 9U TaxID=2653158 RepID=UPI0012F09E2E|nr:TetR/AcrR family transcriptional regulator [Novosphingobium sp. 9U]VWX54249.1 Transcriptional regulator [Novosphingobium sp. 9U]
MDTKQEVAGRRMGPVGSDNWHAMLDGAETILREEGHAALTSRRIAEQIGVKQRLVYYYFRTMDDLIVETFRRMSARELARLSAARESAQPLREIWAVCVHTADARLVSQFMALAHRIDDLRREVVHFIDASRSIQVEAIAEAMERSGTKSRVSPAGLTLLATSVALAITRESALGITTGHHDVRTVIFALMDDLEPG